MCVGHDCNTITIQVAEGELDICKVVFYIWHWQDYPETELSTDPTASTLCIGGVLVTFLLT